MEAQILKVDTSQELGRFAPGQGPDGAPSLDRWEVAGTGTAAGETMERLRAAAAHLRTSDVPVAFPTETVYGLGADATRSAAVRGIYAAKGRPSDNPLIVHVSDLAMLRELLTPRPDEVTTTAEGATTTAAAAAGTGLTNGTHTRTNDDHDHDDPIPPIYRPLIARFWPGPLTILLPNPSPSRLAPEVTAGLPTFGARMPASALARTLIRLAGVPLAAPSANASTRPSPTAARHVAEDLGARTGLVVLDGGACGVGVESTVVDGLCVPPVVLRPGGVGIEELRGVEGWEGVRKAYLDRREGAEGDAPRAPGMKYKHYSPRARVVLYEAGYRGGGGVGVLDPEDVEVARGAGKGAARRIIGVIRTKRWPAAGGLDCANLQFVSDGVEGEVGAANGSGPAMYSLIEGDLRGPDGGAGATRVLDLDLGRDIKGIAQGLFSALRDLDRRGADVIFVEGVGDGDDIAAAVMNRLRKAASDIRL
ncbi:telomere recombination-domain-containing protein [Phialemonium atrogriseum]|uniref:Threonylcarbamoyl-AMP synthase n=1 Tax=Phialemonium atrogriseum TaxID=1093897 RepID=A0AAJ0C1J9_9PEZI|nr:telomere recombination-domain-containing protein [Phialemonium atrogriseum]KAK1768443.1 telomere recombination-domain-containing protein [Phialemonium atrogriseum]